MHFWPMMKWRVQYKLEQPFFHEKKNLLHFLVNWNHFSVLSDYKKRVLRLRLVVLLETWQVAPRSPTQKPIQVWCGFLHFKWDIWINLRKFYVCRSSDYCPLYAWCESYWIHDLPLYDRKNGLDNRWGCWKWEYYASFFDFVVKRKTNTNEIDCKFSNWQNSMRHAVIKWKNILMSWRKLKND